MPAAEGVQRLAKAQAVVQRLLKDGETALLFGAPVDLAVLPDYADVVAQPVDLGTVASELARSINSRGRYSSASDVRSDVLLMYDNCHLYNAGPADQPVRDLADRSKALFEQLWQRAGLDRSGIADEQAAVDHGAEEEAVPAELSFQEGAHPRGRPAGTPMASPPWPSPGCGSPS
jgi:hypothetical protein